MMRMLILEASENDARRRTGSGAGRYSTNVSRCDLRPPGLQLHRLGAGDVDAGDAVEDVALPLTDRPQRLEIPVADVHLTNQRLVGVLVQVSADRWKVEPADGLDRLREHL